MFEANRKTKLSLDKLYSSISHLNRGDVMNHEHAAKILGCRPAEPGTKYYALINRLKRRMESDRGISLVSVPLVGYELATPKGQLDLAHDRTKRATRQIRKGAKSVDCLPVEECSLPEQRAKLAMTEKLALLERNMRQESQRIAFLMRPRDTMPRPHRPDDGETESDAEAS